MRIGPDERGRAAPRQARARPASRACSSRRIRRAAAVASPNSAARRARERRQRARRGLRLGERLGGADRLAHAVGELLIARHHGLQALLGIRAGDARQREAGLLAGQAAHHLIQELQAVGQALRGRSRIAHARGEPVQILLNALHHELETLQITAHALELLHAHRARQIAQLREQLGRQIAGFLIRCLNGLARPVVPRRPRARPSESLFHAAAFAGAGTRVRQRGAQALEARRALGQRIECARLRRAARFAPRTACAGPPGRARRAPQARRHWAQARSTRRRNPNTAR